MTHKNVWRQGYTPNHLTTGELRLQGMSAFPIVIDLLTPLNYTHPTLRGKNLFPPAHSLVAHLFDARPWAVFRPIAVIGHRVPRCDHVHRRLTLHRLVYAHLPLYRRRRPPRTHPSPLRNTDPTSPHILSPVHTSNIVEATFDFVEAAFDFIAQNGNNDERVNE